MHRYKPIDKEGNRTKGNDVITLQYVKTYYKKSQYGKAITFQTVANIKISIDYQGNFKSPFVTRYTYSGNKLISSNTYQFNTGNAPSTEWEEFFGAYILTYSNWNKKFKESFLFEIQHQNKIKNNKNKSISSILDLLSPILKKIPNVYSKGGWLYISRGFYLFKNKHN